ncbi:CrcB family protein [Cellulosimicrobium terreum]|nr:CrcB family protein [Cellulosimicrobium terreum]
MTGPDWVIVAVAGGLGAAARFVVDTLVARHNRLSTPLGTLVVNVGACLLLGLVTGWGLNHGSAGSSAGAVVAVLGTGFLGGYSTFSTASVEAARLLLAGRGIAAILHAGGMLVAGILAAALGIALTA